MNNELQYGPHLFPGGPIHYIRCENQNILDAHDEIILSLANALDRNQNNSISEQIDIQSTDKLHISFMNYGNTELVYLLTINENKKHTLLINQPHMNKEIIKKQFQNLKTFYDNDSRFIIKPHALFENSKYAMYLTEYITNALCVGNKEPNLLGVWNPLPTYHFEEFNKNTTDKVNISRIAHLINTYDNKNQVGISKTEISGNDFMLTQNTDFTNLESIIDNTKIISARDNISISFDKYVNLIKKEFQIETYRNSAKVITNKIKINHHSQMPISIEIIEKGIKRGLTLKND